MQRLNRVFGPLAAACAAVFTASAADGTWVSRADVGTSVANFAVWSDAANWEGGTIPSSLDDTATLDAAANRYIRFGGEFALKELKNSLSADAAVLVGDDALTLSAAGDLMGVCLYSPWKRNGGTASLYAGLWNAWICGDCSELHYRTLLKDTVRFGYDRYASAAGGTRTNGPIPGGSSLYLSGGARVWLTAPRGTAETRTATFAQTAGSPFLVAVGDHETLPVGTAVTGAGIPDGTWLKRIFPDGSIELSSAATTTVDANALAFAPLAVAVTQTLGEILGFNAAGGLTLGFQKYGSADAFRVEVKGIRDSASSVRTVFFTTEAGFLPATTVFTADVTWPNYTLDLQSVHFELQGDIRGPKVQSRTATDAVRLTVPDGREQTVSNVVAFAGALVKDGDGTLLLDASGQFGASSTLVVEAGVFAPFLPDGVEAGVIPSLTIRAGAGYRPTKGVRVVNLTLEAGARLDGVGDLTKELVYDNLVGSLDAIVVSGGAFIHAADTGAAFGLVSVSGTAEVAGIGDETVLTYSSDGLVRITGAGTVDLLLVGGGGGGGGYSGGGGGAGGFVYAQQVAVAPGLYSIAVGRGGTGGTGRGGAGANGTASSAFGQVASGGGGGGSVSAGRGGASGGGAGAQYWYGGAKDVASTLPGGAATADGQGFDGGASTNVFQTWSKTQGGGGGGAGGAGETPPTNGKGGAGGVGRACAITGYDVVYAGGGAGGSGGYAAADGGLGGGGDGGKTLDYQTVAVVSAGADGTDGLGGGGGGGGSGGDTAGDGGRGGNGVVILRFRPGAPTALPDRDTLASGGAVTHRKGYEIHTYAEGGTFSLSKDAVVDVLLVGGGGSGGYACGGGGGGGGVVVLTNLFLFAGDYEVGVGAGGATAESWGSNSGEASYIRQTGVAATNLIAHGGGGGGSRSVGKAGASGGGAGGPYSAWEQRLIAGGAGLAGQGHDGGTSLHGGKGANYTTYGGGGGGAGAAGTNADGTTDPKTLGVGGVGIWCDYSGKPVCYGGGGSGGSSDYQYSGTDDWAVPCAAGGGGRGAGILNPYNNGAYPGEAGVDGQGGGGGGGGGNADNIACGLGGRGGTGVVIIRYRYRPAGLAVIVK